MVLTESGMVSVDTASSADIAQATSHEAAEPTELVLPLIEVGRDEADELAEAEEAERLEAERAEADAALKRAEHEDYYDRDTRFTPFSLKV